MNEKNTRVFEPRQVIPADSNWIEGISSKQSVCKVLPKAESVEQKAFLSGLLMAEERASDDFKAGFLAIWTPKVVSDLEHQFRAYLLMGSSTSPARHILTDPG